MSNISCGRTVMIIYLFLLLLMAIANLILEFEFLSLIYLITLIGLTLRYLIIMKE